MTTKTTLQQAAEQFLALKKIAVAGVSRSNDGEAANLIYRKLREQGYTVYALNPHADRIEGDACYPNLAALPDTPDGVVIGTHPDVTPEIVRQCADLGIQHVWMHGSIGSSVSEAAVDMCHQHGITVIPGACPMMFCDPVDFPHKCLRWTLGLIGKLPKKV